MGRGKGAEVLDKLEHCYLVRRGHLAEVLEHACEMLVGVPLRTDVSVLGSSLVKKLTFQDHAISHKIFDVTLRLREDQEDLHNSANNESRHLAIFLYHPV